MRTLTLLTVLAICASAFGQAFSIFDPAMQSPAVASGEPSPYLVSEDCEGTGTPSGWVNSGAVDWDYTSDPLIGSESVSLMPSSSSYTTFSPQSEVWSYAVVKYTTNITVNISVLTIRNSSGVRVAAVTLNSTGTWRVYSGSSTSSGGSHSVNTTYYVWLRYVIGTGSNSIAQMYVSTTATRPESTTVQRLNGEATTQSEQIDISGGSNTLLIFDKIRISTTEIGSNPP